MSSRVRASYLAAYAGVSAAIYYIFLWLPGLPAVGLPELRIELGASIAPILGIVLGPYVGFAAVLVGNIVKSLTPPSPYGMPFILAAPLSALGAGLLVERRWKEPAAIMLLMLIASMFTPPFNPITEYWYVYMFAFFDKIATLLIIPLAVMLLKKGSKYLYASLYLVFLIGRELDKAFGCFVFSLPIVYSGVFGISELSVVRMLFMINPAFYVVGYFIEAAIAFAIAIPLVKALSKAPGLMETLHLKYLKT